MVFHIALEFSDCDEPFVRKLSESGQIGPAVVRQPALAWNDDKVDFLCASGGEGPVLFFCFFFVLQLLSAHGLHASSSTNRAMHDFVIKLALLSRMLGSV